MLAPTGKCINWDLCPQYMNYKYGNLSHNIRFPSKPKRKLICSPQYSGLNKMHQMCIIHRTPPASHLSSYAATVNTAAMTVLQVLWATLITPNVLTLHISYPQNWCFNVISRVILQCGELSPVLFFILQRLVQLQKT